MNLLAPALGAFASGLFPALVASALVCYASLPGFSAGSLSLVASASFFGKVAASAFGGWLSDRMGRSAAIRSASAVSVLAAVPLAECIGFVPLFLFFSGSAVAYCKIGKVSS